MSTRIRSPRERDDLTHLGPATRITESISDRGVMLIQGMAAEVGFAALLICVGGVSCMMARWLAQ